MVICTGRLLRKADHSAPGDGVRFRSGQGPQGVYLFTGQNIQSQNGAEKAGGGLHRFICG